MKKVIIIGSGIGGIATALRLRSMNYDVTVFENNNYPGGKLASFDLGPYRFDAGPSLLTMPHFIDELFVLFKENPRDYFNYKKKDISCKYFWDDGTKLNAYSEKSKFINEINKVLGVKESTVSTYLLKAKRKYDLTKSMFLEQSLHKLKTYLSKDLLIGLFNVFSFQINKTLNQVNELELKEPHLVQLFNRFATYNGSSPYKTPGMMTLVQHLEQEYGTYVSDKGMNNITKSLYDLALRQGIDFKFNSFVSQILVSGKRAIGVSVGEESYSSDIVVSNMDIVPTYKNLLKNHYQPEKTLNQERSSSALIFYWGINKEFKNLDLHNVLFSNDYKKEFQSIFEKKTIFSDPTVYINITSKDVKGDAPDNCENWFVMINSPNDSGQDWDNMIDEVKSNILKKINKLLNIDLEDYIEYEKVYTPKTIESNTQSYMGSLYGSSSNNLMSAFLRHPNFSNETLNLYFCGGSVHPGGGIPLCLLSAKIVSQLIKNK
ncbi:phytoene desaturase family protein [Flavobacteriaceae bacterium]|nr:phytoene desaturase family protein [Flavobacteriaceae bacterium]MDB4050355.1 phytoene desaturase family protein [Flavobacteriaceae bacterium]MDB4086346.1 phytoene desaturase family protein [Flavobacteriaceae bacterium]MDB4240556.1 phytoene desaturase family protein [Flavobacteriaceae bacterium]MDB9787297.1 phytoene desaturase family protein [Flavobacteriaceae bacterium]